MSYSEAHEFKLILESCEEQGSTSSVTDVRCTYEYHALRSDEIGLGPFLGNWYDLTVRDGEILSVSGHFEFMSNGFSSQIWEPFA